MTKVFQKLQSSKDFDYSSTLIALRPIAEGLQSLCFIKVMIFGISCV